MNTDKYIRKVTPIERFFTYSPFSLVSMIARIKGKVSKDQLMKSVSKLSQKHSLLKVKITDKNNGDLWFTSEEVEEIPIEVINRETSQQWMEVLEEKCKVPFEFDKRPPIRFILIQSPTVSELIILCHHIICDGLSLAYLTRDLMTSLGNPNNEIEILPDPMPINFNNSPSDISTNWLVKFVINRMNKKWETKKVIFNQEDYLSLNEAYWSNFNHKMISIELSETQTTELIKICKKESVSVNSALTTAFVGAQVAVRGNDPSHSSIGIAANLRNRLPIQVGESMGFYAGMIKLKWKYDIQKTFWDNARQFHKKIKPQFTNKNLFRDFVSWLNLDPTIIEAINFKKLGGLVNSQTSTGEKLNAFSKNKDIVMSILKRDKMDSFEHKIMGTAVTNLTKMDFSRTYGDLELDRLILYPGGAFPLGNINLVVGAVTCSGKLSLIVEYAEEAIDIVKIEKIKERAMMFLSNT